MVGGSVNGDRTSGKLRRTPELPWGVRLRSRFVWFTLFLLYFGVVAVPSANAYIDPGSGSFIFQVLIGGLLAGAVAVKHFWRRIVSFFTRRSSREQPAEKID
jgi:hypothetical protein